jgi:hypothetical protein
MSDLLEACALLFGQRTGETDVALDAVNEAFFVLRALLAIF